MTPVSRNSDKEFATSEQKTAQTPDSTILANNGGHNASDFRPYQQWLTGRWGTLVLSLVLFCAALWLDLRHLAAPSIWFDEAFSVELARQPLPLLWHIIFGPEPNMELYYLFLHFWLGMTQALGLLPTEFVVRFPSAIFAALSTVAVFWLGKRYINLFTGILASALYMLNYLQLVYAQQTRSYSLQLLLICIAWYALFRAFSISAVTPSSANTSDHEGSQPSSTSRLRNNAVWWIVYVLAMALAVYAHLFSLLILLSQVVAVVLLLLIPNAWRAPMRSRLPACIGSLFALMVLILPMLIESRQGAKTGWLPVPQKNDVIYLTQMLSGFSRTYLLAMALFCAVGVLLVALAYTLSLSKVRQQPAQTHPEAYNMKATTENASTTSQHMFPVTLSLLCWLLLPPIVSYVISHSSLRLFSARYLVVIVPPLCLLVALGVSTLRWPALLLRGKATQAGVNSETMPSTQRGMPIAYFTAWAIQAGCALLLVGLALPIVPQYYKSAQVEDWNTVTHWIIQHYQQNDGLVCYDNDVQQGCQISVEYYLHAYPSAAHFSSDSPGAFSWTQYAANNPDAAVNPNALAAYGKKHTRIFFIVGRLPNDSAATKAKAAQQWLDSHFHLVGAFNKSTVTVRLYEI